MELSLLLNSLNGFRLLLLEFSICYKAFLLIVFFLFICYSDSEMCFIIKVFYIISINVVAMFCKSYLAM